MESNQLPSGYEPPALTDELHPRNRLITERSIADYGQSYIIKTVIEKIKTIFKSPYIQQFRDVRAVGLALFALVAVVVTWSGIKAVQVNYNLQKQISKLQQQVEVKKLENNNLKLKNQYLETDQFLELAARRQFGKGAPGETLVLVPKSVALKHSVNIPEPEDSSKKISVQSNAQSNFESWVDFFLNRHN